MITETHLAESLGVPAALLAGFRKTIPLTMPEHFTRSPAIVYTQAGHDAILAALGADKTDCGAPTIAELVIVRLVPNKTIVLAEKKEGGGDLLTLKVPTYYQEGVLLNHFRPGQVCQGRHIEGAVWSFHGKHPTHPRDLRAFISF